MEAKKAYDALSKYGQNDELEISYLGRKGIVYTVHGRPENLDPDMLRLITNKETKEEPRKVDIILESILMFGLSPPLDYRRDVA